jgi:hypothetical protein
LVDFVARILFSRFDRLMPMDVLDDNQYYYPAFNFCSTALLLYGYVRTLNTMIEE